ncbi:lytic transglycosylase domain-containing protein [Streptomyces endophyticus]|uniref:Lytic transglycosylase domain-containing protein n=1 Tax=Streptomyces endophyticus TaxID=714166 RepID=A0ABU6F7L7_9ACTN|nr:lytic transglycosylase domain-containing protein [Streptomyces endophyticus]MEB8339463.1 lytic transglycosylase domain-containing protein [Streptomyces endophyticus]
MAAVFGRRLRRGVMTAAVAAAAVAALSASQAPGVSAPHTGGGNSAADRSDDNPPNSATGPDYYTDLPPLDSPTDDPTAPPGTGGKDGEDSGIPATVLDAYKKAAAEIGTTKPGCNLDWQLLAALGKVESGQARGGDVDADGTTLHAILGPPLDGNGFAKITDTDGGSYDGDTTHDRAVGPMQFIPSTWEWAGRDGNGDGKKDPNNIYDAALAAGHYLCRADRDLSNASDLNKAILSYNNSSDYLATVLKWLEYYRKHSHSVPDGTGVLPKHPSGGGTGSASPSPSPTHRNSDRPSDSPTTKDPSKKPPKTPSGGGSTTPGGNTGGGGSDSPGGTTPPPTTSPTQSVTKLADAGTGGLAALQDDSFSERVKVKAKNAAGSAVGSAKIRFAVVGDTDATFSGGATSATVTTNGSGVATAPALKAGKKTGQFKVRATVVGRNVTGLDHTATVTARADKLARADTDPLTCEAGGTFDKAVELKATYKGAAADKVAATATLITSEGDATEADKGPYFKDAEGKTIRTLKGLTTDADGHLTLPKLYADDTTGTFLLRVTTTGGATLDVELKVTAATAS